MLIQLANTRLFEFPTVTACKRLRIDSSFLPDLKTALPWLLGEQERRFEWYGSSSTRQDERTESFVASLRDVR